MATTPTIVDVTPAPGAQGIPIGNPLRIVFNQEMDLDSLNEGTIVLTGPDEAPVFGPTDVTPFDTPGFDDEDILSSPYFKGYVKGTLSFIKTDASGGELDDSIVDEDGDGDKWYTAALFTPDKPLKPNVEYTAIVLGDEASTDDFDTGVKTRTVFDTKFTGSGSGEVLFQGGFTGDTETTYVVQITVGGPTGDAQYIWWNANDPLTTYQGVTTTGERELEYGIYITCSHDGSFTVDDKFEAVVVPPITLSNNYRWSFHTGSGAIITPPSQQSTSGIKSVLTNVVESGVESSTTSFGVESVTPADGEYGVGVSEDPYTGEVIVIKFSDAVNAATLAGNAIRLTSEAANGDTERITATGELDFVAVLTNPTTLTITLDPGQLYANNIVILELDELVADTDGNTLATDYTSYFSTPYTPLYSGYRRIQLDLGAAIADVPEETVMLAILEASIHADAISFSTSVSQSEFFVHARRQYTTCLAERILVKGLLGEGGCGRMSKKLGDLSISRGGGEGGLGDILDRLEDCILAWMTSVQTGGEITPFTSVKPQVGVKGSEAEDAIFVSRQWEPTSGLGVYSNRSAGNTTRYASGRRDLKTFRSRNSRRDRSHD